MAAATRAAESEADARRIRQRIGKGARAAFTVRAHHADPVLLEPNGYVVRAPFEWNDPIGGRIPAMELCAVACQPVVTRALDEERQRRLPVGKFLRDEARMGRRIDPVAQSQATCRVERCRTARQIVDMPVSAARPRKIEEPPVIRGLWMERHAQRIVAPADAWADFPFAHWSTRARAAGTCPPDKRLRQWKREIGGDPCPTSGI